MKPSTGLYLFVMIAVSAACGGEQLGTLDGGGVDEGVPPDDEGGFVDACASCPEEAGSGFDTGFFETGVPDSPVGDELPSVGFDAGVVCKPGTGTGTVGSNGSCSTNLTETCSNGFTYKASCDCPKAKCDCTSMSGSSGGGVVGASYSGCADTCSDDNAAWEACGYPH